MTDTTPSQSHPEQAAQNDAVWEIVQKHYAHIASLVGEGASEETRGAWNAISGLKHEIEVTLATPPAPVEGVERLIDELWSKAETASRISREMAEAKSLRQEGNREGRTDLYMWAMPDETLEGRAAKALTALRTASPEQGERQSKPVGDGRG